MSFSAIILSRIADASKCAYHPVRAIPYRMVGSQLTEPNISKEADVVDTRSELLRVAKRLFAERGFYGVSIAQVADELGLTKQALLHHFGSKERLYGEVLARIASGLSRTVSTALSKERDPERILESLFTALHEGMRQNPENTQLLMRELLDNRTRAETARSWYLKDFLDALVAIVRGSPAGRKLTVLQASARVYLALGAVNYLVVSEPTLCQMYSDEGGLEKYFSLEIKRLARLLIA
jgi:AcrR family transcriptional regulator